MSDQRRDYGPRGCCGPSALLMLIGLLGSAGLMVWYIVEVVRTVLS